MTPLSINLQKHLDDENTHKQTVEQKQTAVKIHTHHFRGHQPQNNCVCKNNAHDKKVETGSSDQFYKLALIVCSQNFVNKLVLAASGLSCSFVHSHLLSFNNDV